MPARSPRLKVPPSKHAAETTMTTGNVLYFAMSIGTFSLLSVALAYQSWRQSSLGPEMVRVRTQGARMQQAQTQRPEPHGVLTA
jgi:hypothetical protein